MNKGFHRDAAKMVVFHHLRKSRGMGHFEALATVERISPLIWQIGDDSTLIKAAFDAVERLLTPPERGANMIIEGEGGPSTGCPSQSEPVLS